MTIRLSHGLFRRRGALPRVPDRMQILDDEPWPTGLRAEVLEQFTVKARMLARNAV